MKIKKFTFPSIIFAFGLIVGIFFSSDLFNSSWISSDAKNIRLCFTPPSGCADLIATEIMNAKSDIFIQAYVLTHKSILDAILYAADHGVDVNVLLDYKSYKLNLPSFTLLKSKKINVSFDKIAGLAHNKVIIIDKTKVITGSFNFTNAADTRNAENVILIEDEKIALEFLNNWVNRKLFNSQKLAKKVTPRKSD